MLLTASVSQRPTPSYSIQAAGAAAVAAAASAAARHTLVAVRGADHAYSKPEQLANAVEQVLEWLVPNLQAREGKATSQSRFTFGM
jgi:mannose-1-phosphate guanylyltransferase